MANQGTATTTTTTATTASTTATPISTHYTCVNSGACEPCEATEQTQPYCQDGSSPNSDSGLLVGAFKQPVECRWDSGVAKEYQDSHPLPKYVACDMADLGRRAFFRNQLVFVLLGLAAFVLYLWRRRRLASSATYSAVQ
ncbi:hypothetical protein IWW48_002811 [Coemansia sp. RSA 1200]|nr:hypothetical protein IWW48_002811 [Coemansia sp. RSA 1200]